MGEVFPRGSTRAGGNPALSPILLIAGCGAGAKETVFSREKAPGLAGVFLDQADERGRSRPADLAGLVVVRSLPPSRFLPRRPRSHPSRLLASTPCADSAHPPRRRSHKGRAVGGPCDFSSPA